MGGTTSVIDNKKIQSIPFSEEPKRLTDDSFLNFLQNSKEVNELYVVHWTFLWVFLTLWFRKLRTLNGNIPEEFLSIPSMRFVKELLLFLN